MSETARITKVDFSNIQGDIGAKREQFG